MLVKYGVAMKLSSLCLGGLIIFAPSVVAQTACRQATGQVLEHQRGVTIYRLSLPTSLGEFRAKAFVPDTSEPGDPAVFSFSTLFQSETKELVDVTPLAMEIAKHGEPNIVVERRLTWPGVTRSVGRMQAVTICAEQWLAKHAAVRTNHWRFVGPESDSPDVEQFAALGDTASVKFLVEFPLAGGPEEVVNTENALRSTSPMLNWLLTPFVDGY